MNAFPLISEDVFVPIEVSFINSSVEDISDVIESIGQIGILTVKDLPCDAPFDCIGKVFDSLHQSGHAGIDQRLNTAYTRNFDYKDAFADGDGRADVDMKRVLDLIPEKMAIIATGADKELTDLLTKDGIVDQFGTTFSFWKICTSVLAPKMLQALAKASGNDGVLDDVYFNCRMIDYYERPINQEPPRCAEHKDFGTLTIIFADQKGLEVQIEGKWWPLAVAARGSAYIIFGRCTEIRSNGRISACVHRVADNTESSLDGRTVPRRLSAVLFVAPIYKCTRLEPVVREGEKKKFDSVLARELEGHRIGNRTRKWKTRQDTMSTEEKKLEEEFHVIFNDQWSGPSCRQPVV